MATDRVKEWVKETKDLANDAGPATDWQWYLARAVVYALLTIAIAIHEAAATKKVK